MTTWTEIPPWLYQNDLPDEQLQAVYVRGAERKLEQLLEERRVLDEQIAEAEAFVQKARRALAVYQRRLRG